MEPEEATSQYIAALLASSPAPIVAFDRDSIVTAWNPAAERLFGWSAEEVLGRPYLLVPEDGELQYRVAIERVLNGTMISSYEARRSRKDGSLVDVSIALAPIRNEAEQITGVLSIFNDISEQRTAENRAIRLADVLMAIREVNQLIVREKDPSRLIRGVIDCLLKYRGYYKAWIALHSESGALELRAHAGIGKFESTFNEAFCNDDLPRCISETLNDPGARIIEDRMRTCSGCPLEQAYPESQAIIARLEHNNRFIGVLGLSLMVGLEALEEERDLVAEIAGDVAFGLHSIEVADERRRAEESLRRAEEQAKQQHEQLMQADKMVALGTLVSGVGHEINNPNNFVMLNVPLLKGMWNDAIPLMEKHCQEDGDCRLRGIPFFKAREMIPELFDDIMEGAWRIKRIVGELKDYARSQPTPSQDLVDINEIARSAIVLCNTFIHQRTQRFTTEYADELPQIRGNGQRIEQVIINLLQNACEALLDNHGAVSLEILFDQERDGVVITVADEGVGIAGENLARIMDPFYTTKRSAGGTGLGLSITERIIRDHGGELTFDSSPGKGTVARVFLPRVIGEGQEEQ